MNVTMVTAMREVAGHTWTLRVDILMTSYRRCLEGDVFEDSNCYLKFALFYLFIIHDERNATGVG